MGDCLRQCSPGALQQLLKVASAGSQATAESTAGTELYMPDTLDLLACWAGSSLHKGTFVCDGCQIVVVGEARDILVSHLADVTPHVAICVS